MSLPVCSASSMRAAIAGEYAGGRFEIVEDDNVSTLKRALRM